jgi:cyclic pyranopterin phosphate synthase
MVDSLLDAAKRPLHDLRISVMDRCNFRCPYCMPRATFHENYVFLRAEERLDPAETVRLARVFAALGVRKLRVTGGEPLLLPQLPALVAELCAIPGIADVALTTNGSLLAKHAQALKAAGLQRVTVSLDSTDPDVFQRMNGGFGHVEQVLEGIAEAQRVGLTPVKLNTVIQRGVNDHTALALLERFRGTGVVVRFIEYMDVGNRNRWQRALVVPSRELIARIGLRWPLTALASTAPGEVAERYAFADGAGGTTEVGFISSVTQPFCSSCSRARLSSDGVLYTCLFATQGTNLRSALRNGASDAELAEIIAAAWHQRNDRYSEQRTEPKRTLPLQPKVEMHYIGG